MCFRFSYKKWSKFVRSLLALYAIDCFLMQLNCIASVAFSAYKRIQTHTRKRAHLSCLLLKWGRDAWFCLSTVTSNFQQTLKCFIRDRGGSGFYLSNYHQYHCNTVKAVSNAFYILFRKVYHLHRWDLL